MADAAGCLARVDNDRYPWVSPAGMRRGQILNTVRLKEQPSDAVQTHLLSKKINFATTIPTQGTYLFSDRTLDEDTSPYRNINISRLLIYLIKNITPIANQYLFEINNERTRTSFVNAITPIFTTIQSTNGIETYKIVCDRSNNPDSVVRDNKFVVDVTIRPVNYIDTITIRFTNLDEV
jgi:phage tail sheath protein FI